MSEKYQPKDGDEVEVVLRGEVVACSSRAFRVGANWVYPDLSSEVVSVTKVEPPVKVRLFGPGDTVRSKYSGQIYHLCDTGYITGGRFCRSTHELTSEFYERVVL